MAFQRTSFIFLPKASMQPNPTATTLSNGYSAVPAGHLATVVTSLEMVARPSPLPTRTLPDNFELLPLDNPTAEVYRTLFREVGADWLWFSRLTMLDDELRAILDSPLVEVCALRQGGRNVGMLELDLRQPDECELAYFGLAAVAIGKGIGRALMSEAIRLAWSHPIKRLWVHTCTFDHPSALDFYRRSGFKPCALQVEVAPDPRLTGVLPRTCAQHVPLLG